MEWFKWGCSHELPNQFDLSKSAFAGKNDKTFPSQDVSDWLLPTHNWIYRFQFYSEGRKKIQKRFIMASLSYMTKTCHFKRCVWKYINITIQYTIVNYPNTDVGLYYNPIHSVNQNVKLCRILTLYKLYLFWHYLAAYKWLWNNGFCVIVCT